VQDVILESQVTIENKVSDLIELEVIPAYLDSILLNLVTNAIKYRSPDRFPVIEISTQTDGDYLVLLVKDNGLGLDLNKFKDKLFGMYKTFHNNPNSRGIGLFITKNQIEEISKPVYIYNYKGIYDNLVKLITDLQHEGFVKHDLDWYKVRFFTDPKELVDELNKN
jgi:light-regulated signal transduction histidine kinase (bacteriophytochrome)